MFPQHFLFSQTSTPVSITLKKHGTCFLKQNMAKLNGNKQTLHIGRNTITLKYMYTGNGMLKNRTKFKQDLLNDLENALVAFQSGNSDFSWIDSQLFAFFCPLKWISV